MLVMVLGGVILTLVTQLVLAHIERAADGKVPRDTAWAPRTRAMNASDQAWQAGHRAAARWAKFVVDTSIFLAIALIILGFVDGWGRPSPVSLWVVAVGCGIVVVAYLTMVPRADRAARAALPEGPSATSDQPGAIQRY